MKHALSLITLAFLASCATTKEYRWVNPQTLGTDQPRQDFAACRMEANKATAYMGYNMYRVAESNNILGDCMVSKGYSLIEIPRSE